MLSRLLQWQNEQGSSIRRAIILNINAKQKERKKKKQRRLCNKVNQAQLCIRRCAATVIKTMKLIQHKNNQYRETK